MALHGGNMSCGCFDKVDKLIMTSVSFQKVSNFQLQGGFRILERMVGSNLRGL